MAQLTHYSGQQKRRGKSSARQSPKLDMTAMVDVAFLLLTFFVLSASLTNDHMMELVVPPSEHEPLKVDEDRLLTLVLDHDSIWAWQGILKPETLSRISYSPDGLRKKLLEHQRVDDPLIVLMPQKSVRYERLVDALDELAITQSRHYALTDLPADYEQALANFPLPESN